MDNHNCLDCATPEEWDKAAYSSCDFCKRRATDSTDFEVGNGAEIQISVELCKVHLAEMDKDENAFSAKYSDKLEAIGSEWGAGREPDY